MTTPTRTEFEAAAYRCRAALQELVALKALKDECDADIASPQEHADYARRKPVAWAEARTAIAAAMGWPTVLEKGG